MTTLYTAADVPFSRNRFLQRLCLAFALWVLYTAWRPLAVFDYWLENVLTIVFIGILAATYRRVAFSDLSYALIFAFLAMHEWGAHYKYSIVPLGEWLKPAIETPRNHYDRIMHFAYGLFLAYPMQEWFVRAAGVTNGFRYFLPIQFALACSAVYELLEALAAGVLSPERGEEFVGMQGDLWDAQHDMFLAAAGACVAMAALAAVRQWKPRPVRETHAAQESLLFR